MANKPSVTLTFGGDTDQLSRAVDKALDKGDQFAKGVEGDSDRVRKALDGVGGSSEGNGERARKSFEKVGDSFKDAGKSILSGVGFGIGDSLAEGILGGFEQSNVGGLLGAQLGGGSEAAARYGRLAGQVYADNFGSSMEDAAAGLKGVQQFHLIDPSATDADVKRATESLMTVGQVVEEDSGAVARAVSQMIRTGLVKNAQEGFDLIVAAEQKGVNKSQDLLDTLNEYGTQFRKLGLEGPTAVGLLSQAIQAGARDSDTAADALKEFSIRAIDGSKTTSDAMRSLFGGTWKQVVADIAAGGPKAEAGLGAVLDKLRGVKDPAQQAQIAVSLFGTKAEDLGKALFAMDTKTAADGMGNLAGRTDEAMHAIGDTPQAKFEQFKRSMEQNFTGVINAAAPVIQAVTGFVSQYADVLLPVAGVIGGIVVAQWAWNAAMEANPFVLIATLVAGLVVGLIALWNHSAAFRDFFIGIWNGIKTAVGGAVDWIRGAWDGVGRFFEDFPGRITRALSGLAAVIVAPVKGAINAVIDALNWALRHSINWAIGTANDIVASIPGMPHQVIPKIPEIPRLHGGGTVPGMPGTDVLVLAQAGEHLSAAGQGGGGGVGLVVYGNSAAAEFVNNMIRAGEIQLAPASRGGNAWA